MRKLIWLFLFVIISLIIFNGSLMAAQDNQENIVIGICSGSLEEPWQSRVAESASLLGEFMGFETLLASAQWDTTKQISQMEDFIARDVDLILLSAVSRKGLVSSVQKAKENGIPVINMADAVAAEAGFDAYVGSVHINGSGSKLAAEYIINELNGEGNVVTIKGVAGMQVTFNRFHMFKEILEEEPGMKIIYDDYTDWTQSEGMEVMDNALTRFPGEGQIDAIFAQSDSLAIGAIRALERAGVSKEHWPIIVGLNGQPQAIEAIKDGKLSATLYQNAEGIGTNAMKTAIQLLYDQDYAKYTFIPWNVVTKDNVEDFENVANQFSKGMGFLVEQTPTFSSEPPEDYLKWAEEFGQE